LRAVVVLAVAAVAGLERVLEELTALAHNTRTSLRPPRI
jgi:hypothetical protein